MNYRFIVLTIMTSIFQVICLIAFIGGLALTFGVHNAINSNEFLAQAPQNLKSVIGLALSFYGLVLSFYGLMGLVFSGGVHVLISIDGRVHSLGENLSAALDVLKRPVAVPPIQPVHTAVATERPCPQCGAMAEAHNQFCEECGASLSGNGA